MLKGEFTLENDAVTAGVRPGGVFKSADVKILICYVLSAIDKPVPATLLANTLHYEGIANAFEVSDAIVSLSKSGQITPADDAEETYIITQSGREIAKELATSISYAAKDRAYAAALKMVSKFNNAKSTKFEITKENGRTFINCTALDGEAPFISIKLMVTDDGQAAAIKERFLSDPADVYLAVIEKLTGKDKAQ